MTQPFYKMKNCESADIGNINENSIEDFFANAVSMLKDDLRPVHFFAVPFKEEKKLLMIFADDKNNDLSVIMSKPVPGNLRWDSLTAGFSCMNMLEREIHEDEGFVPVNHPWLKPVRNTDDYQFFKIDGKDVHEVGVGPVHAGVIEPGHFRFNCAGEKVLHLEISLGYQKRGVEKLMLRHSEKFGFNNIHQLAESIAGDTVAGHTWAWAAVTESLSDTKISQEAQIIRFLALEMERAAMHAADLGALANDVAYLPGNSVYGANRTLIINSMLEICGSRFTRGLIRSGGVRFGITKEKAKKIVETIYQAKYNMDACAKVMFSSASVLHRFESTGIVTKEQAKAIGMTGMTARASGLQNDVRISHPLRGTEDFKSGHFVFESGDVMARAMIRDCELSDSLFKCSEILRNYNLEKPDCSPVNELKKNSISISMVEGWRGEISHCAITDETGRLIRYKIKDPSLNNWFGLALAVRNNGISDFPLCNKSFNLSYCGNDL
ncbi:MAG TPA: hydrogenase [bacterium]|nr:hydrogenase [bacterium]HQN72512.1 hydrogenase [bacterium]HQO92200.1 hydrogenase [bacterium]